MRLVGPGEAAPAVGVASPLQADLVAVVDAWRAGEGHHEQQSQAERALVATGEREEAGGVVAVEQVELRLRDFKRVQVKSPVKGIGEAGTIASTPAVINAIVDALSPLGVTEMPMPASPLAVWTAIRDARASGDESTGGDR